MFWGRVRGSGSLRSIWHRRERKRRPKEPLPPNAVRPDPRPRRYTGPVEAHWQSGDPATMIRCVLRLANSPGIVFHLSPQATERKLRLFYCACCRLVWDTLSPGSREAVEVVERFAAGGANGRALRAARVKAQAASITARGAVRGAEYAQAGWNAVAAAGLAEWAAAPHRQFRDRVVRSGTPADGAVQVRLLRDLFDDPFRPAALDRKWLTSTVVTLARVIHGRRAFDLMPVLGDALQDAGCADGHVLAHCYGAEVHAPGCWLIDSILANA